jgi:hypothetical protein
MDEVEKGDSQMSKKKVIGYKSCWWGREQRALVKLEILGQVVFARQGKYAKRRTSKARVLSITAIKSRTVTYVGLGKRKLRSARSDYNRDFVYRVGKIVVPSAFDPNPWCECSAGIHYFQSKKKAMEYLF